MKTSELIIATSLGRVLLHLACGLRRPCHWSWHWQGIQRELTALYPSRILSPAAIGLSVCLTAVLTAQSAIVTPDPENRAVFLAPDGSIVVGCRCATPMPTPEEAASVAARLRSSPLAEAQQRLTKICVRVAFHVIHKQSGFGNVTDDQIRRQIDVLNASFLPHDISFELVHVDRTANDSWFANPFSYETAMKQALATDPVHHLNLYTAGFTDGKLALGYARFPNSWPEHSPMHGVVCRYSSLPGGSAAPYNEGDTATHEVGHYFGLYHTFQNGCSDPGDDVADTPAESSPALGSCNALQGRDTCASAGLDPIQNFMDYANDDCMDEFTPGQRERMWQMIAEYRPGLLEQCHADDLRLSLERLTDGTCRIWIESPTGAGQMPAIEVYATTNLALPLANWTRLTGSPVAANGKLCVDDPAARTISMRFYRVVQKP